jgi:O-antigen/teichoic acid export membrane protein
VILRGGSWQAGGQLVPLLVNVLLTPVIIAGLGVDRYGLFLLISVIAMVLSNADGGIGGAALRYFALYVGRGDTVATTRLLVTAVTMVGSLAVVVFGAFYTVTGEVVRLFDVPNSLDAEGTFLLRTMVVITVVLVFRAVFAAVLNAHQRYALTSLTMVVGHVIYVVGILLTLHQGWGLYGVAGTLAAQQLVATVVIVPAACRFLDRNAVGLLTWAETREFARYAWHVQWSNLMLLAILASDSMVVGAFLPVRQVAYYGTGANFALQLRNMPLNALPPIESALGRAVGERGGEAARSEFEWLQRLWVRGTTGWGVVAMAAAWFGVTAWLGPSFAVSGTVAVVMLGGYLVTLWADVLSSWTQVLGHPQLTARSASVAALVNLVLTLSLVVPFGILGTVAATATSQIMSMLVLLWLARRRLPGSVRSFLADVPVLPAVLAAAVVVAVETAAHPFVPSGALGLATAGLLAAPGLAVYAASAFGLRASVRMLAGLPTRLRGRSPGLDAALPVEGA